MSNSSDAVLSAGAPAAAAAAAAALGPWLTWLARFGLSLSAADCTVPDPEEALSVSWLPAAAPREKAVH